MYSKVCVGKLFSDTSPIQNGLEQEDALLPLLFNFALGHQECPTISSWFGIEWDKSAFGLC
jgi:hypothetical protein